jgi:hypothetical protein
MNALILMAIATVSAEAYPTRIVVDYRPQQVNGVYFSTPIYADVPPATPGHTHEELGGAVCRVCGGSCYMLRAAEAAARAKGETSNAAVQAEYTRMYGSGGGYSTGRPRLFGRRRR